MGWPSRQEQQAARARPARDHPGPPGDAGQPAQRPDHRLEGDDDRNRKLLERVNASGEMFISHAVLGGRYVLRLAIGQQSTTADDVRRAWHVLVREAEQV